MSLWYDITLLVTAAIFIYLIVALLKPEIFP